MKYWELLLMERCALGFPLDGCDREDLKRLKRKGLIKTKRQLQKVGRTPKPWNDDWWVNQEEVRTVGELTEKGRDIYERELALSVLKR
jgi:hypothetical protein